MFDVMTVSNFEIRTNRCVWIPLQVGLSGPPMVAAACPVAQRACKPGQGIALTSLATLAMLGAVLEKTHKVQPALAFQYAPASCIFFTMFLRLSCLFSFFNRMPCG